MLAIAAIYLVEPPRAETTKTMTTIKLAFFFHALFAALGHVLTREPRMGAAVCRHRASRPRPCAATTNVASRPGSRRGPSNGTSPPQLRLGLHDRPRTNRRLPRQLLDSGTGRKPPALEVDDLEIRC